MSDVEALDRIDWNFPSTGTAARTVHSGRSFPGNFIPQIPAHLIAALSTSGDTVFDPFSGSGTTAVEALNLGRRSISSDRITASVHLTRSKVRSFLSPTTQETRYELLSALAWPHLSKTNDHGNLGEGANSELERWIAGSTLAQLRYIWKLIEQQPAFARDPLKLVFSDVLFSCASPGRSLTATGRARRHHWGWIADNVYPEHVVEHDPIELFLRKLDGLPSQAPNQAWSDDDYIVIQQDAKQLSLPENSVDLIVTSPPYVGMIDYARANRILYLWNGWDIEEDQSAEIGARYKRFRKEAQAQYLHEIDACWLELDRVLKPGKYLAIVIGESKKFKGTVQQALSLLERLMPCVWGPTPRIPTRRRVSDRNASDPLEYVCVYQKP
ncbi:hypothetical protein PLCT2_02983 [Planctomycetaceae bacterium]|nr:hypothetical protein PLCT2_02983 [Planctomycetaceae bacterium]